MAQIGPYRPADRAYVDAAVLEETAVLDRDDRLLHHRRDVVVVDEDAVLRPPQHRQDVAGRVVDLRVDLVLLLRRVELRDRPADRGYEPEGKRRHRQDEERERQDEQTQLLDPAALPRRRRFTATAKTQDRGSVVAPAAPLHSVAGWELLS